MEARKSHEIMYLIRDMPFPVPTSGASVAEIQQWERPVDKLLRGWAWEIIQQEREKTATYHIIELRFGNHKT